MSSPRRTYRSRDPRDSIPAHQQSWERLAKLDPLWAVLSSPDARGGKWNVDDFFRTGDDQILALMERLEHENWNEPRTRALDFGCGVGRLSRSLARHFDDVVGVDISSEMIRLARTFGEGIENLTFVAIDGIELPIESNSVSLVYTSLVLQHQPSPDVVAAYLHEFARVLEPGGVMVFDVPSGKRDRLPRLALRSRASRIGSWLHIPSRVLHERLRLSEMTMLTMTEAEVRALVTSTDCGIFADDCYDADGVEMKKYYAMKGVES